MATLLIADNDQKTIADATLKAASAAASYGDEIHLLVAGEDCTEAAQMGAKIANVTKVLKADNTLYKNLLAENMANLIFSIADNYDHFIAAATTNGKNYMPRLSALLDRPQLSDVTAINDDGSFERPIYAGNAIQTVKLTAGKQILTIRTTAFPAAELNGNATIEDISTVADSGLSSYVKEELTVSERPELTSAKIVISGGRGMQSGENFTLLEAVADKMGAAIGASRAAVDAGYVPNDYQVGQTGKVVAPELYIAVGISGAIQHLAGMKDSKVIVAINKDEDAPIFQIADYGLVADLFTVLPELEANLD